MQVYAMWHNGFPGEIGYPDPSNVEVWETIGALTDSFRDRLNANGGYYAVTFANGETEDAIWPPVPESSYMTVYTVDPSSEDTFGAEPWFRLSRGPRGGVVRESF